MNIQSSRQMVNPSCSKINKSLSPSQPSKSSDQEPSTPADKVMFGSTLVAAGGLATSMGTFCAMEAGLISMGSSAEMWGGLGGMALFVGGSIVGGIALLASRGE